MFTITKTTYGKNDKAIQIEYKVTDPEYKCLYMWFSYDTVVAFQNSIQDKEPVVVENQWGTTTGKHLNLIDNGNKKTRIPVNQFNALLQKAYREFFGTFNETD